jgi:hypothetical protein
LASLADWLAAFRRLHEGARRGSLDRIDRAAYLAGRAELGQVMLAAQRLSLRPGLTPRRSIRVARALQLDIEMGGHQLRSVTSDLSTGGLSTMLSRAPSVGDDVGLVLRLPVEAPVACRARVTDVRREAEQHRVSARFLDLSPQDCERLELLVFDAILAQFG